MEDKGLLSTLIENGLILPRDYANHKELSLHFVSKYVPLILNGTVDPQSPVFNSDQSNEMLRNIAITLEKMNHPVIKAYYRSGYSLIDSTPIGSWSNSHLYYNCYAYSLGRTRGLQPGSTSGQYFDLTMSISSMADVVLSDLNAMGYWGYKTTTKPSSLSDRWFRVLCIRKDTNNVDYHFMRLYGSSESLWVHKPGRTQPLIWNYSSPRSKIWSNEVVINGVAYSPNVTYESTIYYILYTGKKGSEIWV